MPANRKAEDIEIMRALLEWRGNVKAAAEALGMSRQALNDRILRAGLLGEVDAFRRLTAVSAKVVSTLKVVSPVTTFRSGQGSQPGRLQGCVNSTDRIARPTVSGMSAAAPVAVVEGTEAFLLGLAQDGLLPRRVRDVLIAKAEELRLFVSDLNR